MWILQDLTIFQKVVKSAKKATFYSQSGYFCRFYETIGFAVTQHRKMRLLGGVTEILQLRRSRESYIRNCWIASFR